LVGQEKEVIKCEIRDLPQQAHTYEEGRSQLL